MRQWYDYVKCFLIGILDNPKESKRNFSKVYGIPVEDIDYILHDQLEKVNIVMFNKLDDLIQKKQEEHDW